MPCIYCPSVTGNEARVFGRLDKEVVRGGIRSHIGDVKACYDGAVATHPEARGIMRVRFGIGPSGAVESSCLVGSELNATSVDRCVVDLILKWKFPAPEGAGWVVVSYPFTFVR
jgi:TonB family protein